MGDEAPEASTVDDETLTSLRLPRSLLDRADALIALLKKRPEFAVQRITRSTVLRLALMRGLDALEADHPKSSGPRPRHTTRSE